jgi:hypothetical protein
MYPSSNVQIQLNFLQLRNFLTAFENKKVFDIIELLKRYSNNNPDSINCIQLYDALKDLSERNHTAVDKKIAGFIASFSIDNQKIFVENLITDKNILYLKKYCNQDYEENFSWDWFWEYKHELSWNHSKMVSNMLAEKKLIGLYPEVIEHISSIQEKAKIDFKKKYLSQFHGKFGLVNFAGGALALAAIHATKANKPYKFNPVILDLKDNPKEFSIFLKFIKENSDSLRGNEIKFVLAYQHWIAGSVLVDNNGKIKVLLIDSLGVVNKPTGKWINSYLNAAIKDIVYNIQATPMIIEDVRQYTLQGCSVYAIDDIQHLFSINDYLPEKQNIFTYLENNVNKQKAYLDPNEDPHYIHKKKSRPDYIEIFISKLPLYLMRTKQSTSIGKEDFVKSYSDTEQNIKLSKKQHSVLESNALHFTFSTEKDKEVNARLEYKLGNIYNKVFTYCANNDLATITHDMDSFKLTAFKEKIQAAVAQDKKLSL